MKRPITRPALAWRQQYNSRAPALIGSSCCGGPLRQMGATDGGGPFLAGSHPVQPKVVRGVGLDGSPLSAFVVFVQIGNCSGWKAAFPVSRSAACPADRVRHRPADSIRSAGPRSRAGGPVDSWSGTCVSDLSLTWDTPPSDPPTRRQSL